MQVMQQHCMTFHGMNFHPLYTIQLCYYDSSKDGKCHGTIMIRDMYIEKVEEAEPLVVLTLKENEAGFFFAVSHRMLLIMCGDMSM
jgi:hypothetical protein